MSLHAINKSTDKYSGGGLPVYTTRAYLFSALNQKFNSDIGLWTTPNGKLPSFQIFIPYGNLVSFVYHETTGEGVFTGTTFNAGTGSIQVHAATKNGVQGYWMHTNQDGTMAIQPPNSRWVAILTVDDGVQQFAYYTEEFLTRPCCL